MREIFEFLITVAFYGPPCVSIGLARNILRFFQKFSFYSLNWKVQLAFNNIYSIAVYDLWPTLWQGKNPAFQEVPGLLTKKLNQVHFEAILIVEVFFHVNSQIENDTSGSL